MGITIFAGNSDSIFVTNDRVANNNQKSATSSNGNKNVFYAGNSNLNADTIEMKRKLAQKQAMKLIRDTFASEQKTDTDVESLRAQREQYLQDSLSNKKEAMKIAEKKEQTMEEYGVTEDSKEHQDLELLRKERDSHIPNSGIELTEEEEAYLETLHKDGLTAYQKDMLELDDAEKEYQTRATKQQTAAKYISDSLYYIELERLKTHPMADALDQAAEIMKAANKEIIGDLLNEAKDHFDEEMAEKAEKAEEKKEEEKKAEEIVEEKKAEEAEMKKRIAKTRENAEQVAENAASDPDYLRPEIPQEVISASVDYDNTKVFHELKKMTEELGLIMEDLKGININTSI